MVLRGILGRFGALVVSALSVIKAPTHWHLFVFSLLLVKQQEIKLGLPWTELGISYWRIAKLRWQRLMERRMRGSRREIYCRYCSRLIYQPIFPRIRGWMIVMFLRVSFITSYAVARTDCIAEVPTFLVAGHETTRYIPSSRRRDCVSSDAMTATRQHGRYTPFQSIPTSKPNCARNFSLSSQIIQPWTKWTPYHTLTQ